MILKLVEGMQKIQEKKVKGGHGNEIDPKTVRSSVELPKLAKWSCETGPIDFADWLLVLTPLISDLSASSEEWWNMNVEEAREWYRLHLSKTPFERLSHRAVPSSKLQQKKWGRLERRAAALLRGAVPEALREEIATSKSLSTFGILTKGMVAYQPGGLTERQAILAALEAPSERATIQSGVLVLRRWGVEFPSGPTILARGLSRITSSLLVDSILTHNSITKYSEHVLAELEQLGHQSKRKEPGGGAEVPKIKKFAESSTQKKEGGERREATHKDKEKGRCHFFLSDQGLQTCRRGKSCTYSHDIKDDRRRCWNCGGTVHMATICSKVTKVKKKGPSKWTKGR